MADDRTYIRLHDGFDENHKIVGISDKEFRTYIEALCYCSRNLSDGFIPFGTSKKLATPRVWRALVASGLIEDHADGYVVHDYLEHQRSAEQVKQFKEAKREAGRKGGKARAAAQAEPKQVLEQTPKQTASKSNPEAEAETEEQKTTSSAPRKRGRRMPDDFAVTDEMRQWAIAEGFGHLDLDRVTVEFRDYWASESGAKAVKVDWIGTWRNRVRAVAERTPNNVRQLNGTGDRAGKKKYAEMAPGVWQECHPEGFYMGKKVEWR